MSAPSQETALATRPVTVQVREGETAIVIPAARTTNSVVAVLQKPEVLKSLAAQVGMEEKAMAPIVSEFGNYLNLNPKLIETFFGSDNGKIQIVDAFRNRCLIGLPLGGPFNLAYIADFGGYKNPSPQYYPSYMGLVKLAKDMGKKIDVRIVYEREVEDGLFSIEYDGPTTKIVHKPYYKGHPGEMVLMYAVVGYPDGTYRSHIMRRDELDAVRESAYKKTVKDPQKDAWKWDKCAWATNPDWMMKKTVVRQLLKMEGIEQDQSAAAEKFALAWGLSDKEDEGFVTEAPEVEEVRTLTAKEKMVNHGKAMKAKNEPPPPEPEDAPPPSDPNIQDAHFEEVNQDGPPVFTEALSKLLPTLAGSHKELFLASLGCKTAGDLMNVPESKAGDIDKTLAKWGYPAFVFTPSTPA